MSSGHTGRCLCGNVSYDTGKDPLWVTVCYCRFCQRATGSDRMIEPIFERDSFAFKGGSPTVYTLPSDGSGKDINVHFCEKCGTKLALTFERWPNRIGIYVGTLNDPVSIEPTKENSKHIFASEARPGTILPPGFKIFDRHATENDGTPIEPTVHSTPYVVENW
ncbi:GFA family protein [Tateyamaria pelophila]|uniref:GFA family protein n=1 Tax=Tateyamaria pelophila TaxID=328415 RepID=UPI001CC0DD01|nr:GFA family protein [Tateyamaria pelophila]